MFMSNIPAEPQHSIESSVVVVLVSQFYSYRNCRSIRVKKFFSSHLASKMLVVILSSTLKSFGFKICVLLFFLKESAIMRSTSHYKSRL